MARETTWEIIQSLIQKFIENQNWRSSEQPGLLGGGIGRFLRSTPTQSIPGLFWVHNIPVLAGIREQNIEFQTLHHLEKPPRSENTEDHGDDSWGAWPLHRTPVCSIRPGSFYWCWGKPLGSCSFWLSNPQRSQNFIENGAELVQSSPPPPAALITTSILFLRPRQALISDLPEIYLSAFISS